jgi:hypothetical protein
MKRILLALLGVAMLAGSASAALTSINWTIGVSYSAFTIDLAATGLTASFGTVSANQIVPSNFGGGQPRSTITNNGSGTISYTALATIAGGWSLASNTGSANAACLQGIFTRALPIAEDPAGMTLATTMVQANDVLNGSAKTATNSVLADDAESNTIAVKGGSVDPTNSTRSMRYIFWAPASVSVTTPQTITVTIGAV